MFIPACNKLASGNVSHAEKQTRQQTNTHTNTHTHTHTKQNKQNHTNKINNKQILQLHEHVLMIDQVCRFRLLMVRWVVGSILQGGTIELFLVPASAPRLVYQRPWYVPSCLWDGAHKRTLAANRKEYLM